MTKQRAKGSFIRHVAVLAGGTAISQGVLVLTAPIITRLYSPSEFGTWTLLISIVAFFSVLSGLRYEYAIMLPEDDEEAVGVLNLSLCICTVMSLLMLLVATRFRMPLARLIGAKELAPWMWWLPFIMFLTGLSQVGMMWVSRMKNFSSLSASRVGMSAVSSGVQVTAGAAGPGGTGWLILGGIAGLAASSAILVFQMVRYHWRLLRAFSWPLMKKCAVRYKNFPLYSAPYALVGIFRERLIYLLLGSYATVHVVGLYGLALKLTWLPILVIAGSLNTVFYQKAAVAKASGDFGGMGVLVARALKRVAVLATPVLVLFLFNAKWLFPVLLGKRWADCAIYAMLLSLPAFIMLFTAWLDRVMDVISRQRLALGLQLGYTVLSLGAFAYGLIGMHSPIWAVGLHAGATVLYNIVWLVVLFRVAHFPMAGFASAGVVLVGVLVVCTGIHWLASMLLGTASAMMAYIVVVGAIYAVGAAIYRRRVTQA